MKRTLIILSCVAFFACNQKGKDEQNQAKTNSIVWAETAESDLLVNWDSTRCAKDYWDEVNKIDKSKIFNSIKNAVLNKKLKAYTWYPNGEMTIAEFNAVLVQWDSTNTIEDVNHPGTIVSAPIKFELKPEDLVELRFEEKIELDTVTYTLNRKVSVIHFVGDKLSRSGEVIGKKLLFDVKLSDGDNKEAKK